MMYRNGQFYYQTFSSPACGPIILVFQKETRLWNSDFEIPTESPSTGAANRGRVGLYQKFAIFNQYFRNTDTDTEYWGISKYRYRILNRHEKNTDENTEYRYRLQIPIRPSSSLYWTISVLVNGTAVPVERLGTLHLCPCVETQCNFPHSWIVPFYQAEWKSVIAALCRCCCYCLVVQLWILIAYASRRRYGMV